MYVGFNDLFINVVVAFKGTFYSNPEDEAWPFR